MGLEVKTVTKEEYDAALEILHKKTTPVNLGYHQTMQEALKIVEDTRGSNDTDKIDSVEIRCEILEAELARAWQIVKMLMKYDVRFWRRFRSKAQLGTITDEELQDRIKRDKHLEARRIISLINKHAGNGAERINTGAINYQ